MSVELSRALAAAAQRIGVAGLRVVGEPLAGSLRAVVVRTVPLGDDASPGVVVKAFDLDQTDEGWGRESAALSVFFQSH